MVLEYAHQHSRTKSPSHVGVQYQHHGSHMGIFLKQVLLDIKATGWDLHYQSVVYRQCDDMVQARE